MKAVENYIRNFPHRRTHTPQPFLQQKQLVLEQEILIKTIKQAIRDIVHVFGQNIDYTGLDSEAADLCQRVWDLELI